MLTEAVAVVLVCEIKWLPNAYKKKKIGTFLFDLLTEEEDRVYENRFQIDILTSRLISATQWILENKETKKYAIAYFGASTGASSALKAAASLRNIIKAVVSRGGRPYLAVQELPMVTAPSCLLWAESMFLSLVRIN